eukprot:jgi/Mesvir1/14343/Mv09751-RA.1
MRGDASAIIGAAFNSTPTAWERLAYLTDTFGPRFSGTPALDHAIDYLRDAMRADGLTVVEEPTMIPRWVRGEEGAELKAPRVKKINMVGLGGSCGTPDSKPIRAKLLVVSSFDDLTANCSAAHGRIVVFNVPFVSYGASVEYRTRGGTAAGKCGAVAALVRSIAPFGLQTVHAGATDSDYEQTTPSAAISMEDAMMLARMQARGQDPQIEMLMSARTLPDVRSRNLVADIPGTTHPDELVLFGAHMDSWDVADGAVDDGGGVLAAWEALRLLHALGIKLRRTVRVVLFVNEENGSRGAQQYAQDHQEQANKTSLAMECDEGTFTPWGLGFTGSPQAHAIMRAIGKELLGGVGGGNISVGEPGEDITFLSDLGVPSGNVLVEDPRMAADAGNNPCAAFVPKHPHKVHLATDGTKGAPGGDGYFWYHHTGADTVDKVDPRQLQHAAAVFAVWAAAVADLPELLPRAAPDISGCRRVEGHHHPYNSPGGFTDRGLAAMAPHLVELETLQLSFCRTVKDVSLVALAKCCRKLRSVDVVGCSRVTDVGACAVAAHCPRLVRLNAMNCRAVTDVGLMAVSEHCPLLELLVSACPRITVTGIKAVMSNFQYDEELRSND